MNLAAPLELGGGRYLTDVSVGRNPDADRVRDCPACQGYCYDDEWHLAATVEQPGDGTAAARYVFCEAACLRGWLRLVT